ncbi:hypothetical protein ACW23B_24650 [Streptomyces albidoflavus]
MAAVAGAVAASQLGVYGTVIGAGVMSVVATTGGSVFQHLFRRTGEQIRHVRPKTEPGPDVPDTFRADPEPDPLTDPAPGRLASADPATAHTVPGDPPAPVEATQLLGRIDPAAPRPADAEATQLLGQADPEATQLLSQADPGATKLLGQAGPDATRALRVPAARPAEADQATRLLRAVPEPSGPRSPGSPPPPPAAAASWKRPVITAAAVFVLAMGGITGWELVSGHALSGDSGPTISHLTGNRSQPSVTRRRRRPHPRGHPPARRPRTAPPTPRPPRTRRTALHRHARGGDKPGAHPAPAAARYPGRPDRRPEPRAHPAPVDRGAGAADRPAVRGRALRRRPRGGRPRRVTGAGTGRRRARAAGSRCRRPGRGRGGRAAP